ncbi:hypothetical protein [Nitrosomonas ureae]|uniref:Uncharacterized protein n=1 Tax=Nitrosomonas ureae TaxID=44577 RepID=A0A1H9HIX3_9PROT|nr:hypothetical protein [Nitrosomonas ureae]SEQ62301.1 hypothetical protein SAMN05421510_11132 [Nitrosomonas ureae]
MNKFSNSGHRILNILLKLQNQSQKINTAKTWANILEINDENVESDSYELNQKLILIRNELNLFEKKMINSKYTEDLYKPYVEHLKLVVTPISLNANWSQYSSYINGELILSFKFCAQILDDEPLIDFTELQNLFAKINDFKETVSNSTLNETQKQFILDQIDILEKAINNYPIMGNSAIIKAFEDGYVDYLKNSEIVESINDDHTFKNKNNLPKLWSELKTISKVIVQVDKISNAFVSITEKYTSLIDSASKSIN